MTAGLPGPLWLIGCGNMAGAMLEGWLAAGLDPSQITVVRPSGRDVAPGVRVLTALPEGAVPAVVLLGVKPALLDDVAPALAGALDPATILVSILAGVELAALQARFPDARTILRAMPNMPVRLRQGAIGLCARGDADAVGEIERLMALLGLVERVDEDLFDAVTALSGSGPAFLFRFIDALARAGEEIGLPLDQSARLALATVSGAAALARDSDEDPDRLADRVASPGGSTRKGLDVLDADRRLERLLTETLEAAVRRNREMAEAPR